MSTLAAFQGNEQERGVGERAFEPQIFVEDLENFRRQGHDALLVSFAKNPHLRIGQLEILQLESQHFTGAQAIEQHQAYQGEIAKGAKAVPESGDFVCR